MNANHRSHPTLQHERLLYKYSAALDRGDFATVAEILAQSVDDPILERQIVELNAAHAAELGTELASTHKLDPRLIGTRNKDTIMVTPKSLPYPQPRSFATAALLIALLAMMALVLALASSNPQTLLGIVFISTPTLAPTSTPTPVAPSTGTRPAVPITAANVDKLNISQILGRGYFNGGFAWSGNVLAVSSPLGISIFNTDDLTAAPVLIAYQVNQLGFSADGKTLITVTMNNGDSEITGTIAYWDVATRRQERTSTLKLGTDGAWFSDFVAGNTLLPYKIDDKLRFYNLLTDQVGLELSGPSQNITGLTLSPDGKYVAVGTVDKKLHIWEVSKPAREKYVLTDAREQIYSMTFTPDSRSLITVDNRLGTLRLWDMQTGKQTPLSNAGGSVFDIKFSPDGKQYVTANQDGSINLINADTNIPIIRLTGHHPTTAEVRAVARLSFNADGSQLASVGDDGTIKLWDMRGGQEITTLDSRSVCPDQLGYSGDGRKLLAMCEDSIQVWDVANTKLLFTTRTDTSNINSARLSLDGKYVAFTQTPGLLQLWDIEANKRMLIHEIQRDASSTVNSGGGTFTSRLSFSYDGKWLAFAHSFDSVVWLYNLASKQEQALTSHKQTIYGLQFSPDDRTLLSFSADGSANLWDIPAGTLRATTDDATNTIAAVQFNPAGSLIVVAHDDGTLELRDAATLAIQSTLHTPPAGDATVFYSGLAFSPDGSVLASFFMPLASPTATNIITFWDVRTQQQLATLNIPVLYLRSMALSPDGTQLAVSVGGAVLLYQVTP